MGRHRPPARSWPQSAVLGSGLLVGAAVLFLQHELSPPHHPVGLTPSSISSQASHSARPTPTSSTRHPAADLTYVVKPGDSLTSISRYFLKRGRKVGPSQWRGLSQNPDLIRPGQVIVLGPTGRLSISR